MRTHLLESARIAALAGLALLGAFTPAQASSLVDTSWLASSYWDDGRAEVAFYEVERNRNQYGQEADQRFPVGTYLVKHDYDLAAEAKASPGARERLSAFKWALFYEFESGAYQYKRSYVTNAAQADLAPLKTSLASFDWCSNLYREMAFRRDGTVAALLRSDDYGNRTSSFTRPEHAYPFAELPLLVRALDFSSGDRHAFQVLLDDGTTVAVSAELVGREPLATPAGTYETEKITVSYDGAVPSLVGETADGVEHYWRDTGPGRVLVQLEAESGRYRLVLLGELRSDELTFKAKKYSLEKNVEYEVGQKAILATDSDLGERYKME